jgi:hypothetical protein
MDSDGRTRQGEMLISPSKTGGRLLLSSAAWHGMAWHRNSVKRMEQNEEKTRKGRGRILTPLGGLAGIQSEDKICG